MRFHLDVNQDVRAEAVVSYHFLALMMSAALKSSGQHRDFKIKAS